MSVKGIHVLLTKYTEISTPIYSNTNRRIARNDNFRWRAVSRSTFIDEEVYSVILFKREN